MKRILTLILTVATLFTFVACTEKTAKEPVVADILKEIRNDSGIDLPDMAEITVERINGYYEIDAEQIEELSYIIAGSGATTDEILIAKMVSDEAAKTLVSKMGDRKTQIADLFGTYNPDEMPKVESCVIEQSGRYAFFAICNDNDKAKKIFKGSF